MDVTPLEYDRVLEDDGGGLERPVRLEFPFLDAGRGVDGVEVQVVAPEVDDAVGDRGRAPDRALRLEPPLLLTGRGVERVDVPV